MSSQKVSVITPAFNAEAYISEAIESVLSQTYSDWELLIVDDCSTDSTAYVVKKYLLNDKRIRYFPQSENRGAAVARNLAIEAATGRYIAFLDSDDLWCEDKLESQINFMNELNCPFTFTAYTKIEEEGSKIIDIGVPGKVEYSDMLKTCYIGCLTAIYDTEYYGKVKMPLIKKRQDYGLWLELLKKSGFALGINKSLAHYRIRKGSISSNKIKASRYNWFLYREVERLSYFKSVYYFTHYAIRSVLRYKFPKLSIRLGVLHDVEDN